MVRYTKTPSTIDTYETIRMLSLKHETNSSKTPYLNLDFNT